MREYGIGGVTHTFSGMRGFHHREPGVAGAALYFDDMMCEFAKQTGMTVSHEAFDIAYRIKGSGRIILTTDCSGLAQTCLLYTSRCVEETGASPCSPQRWAI